MSYEGDDFFDPDHCPYCRAMADLGIHPNESVTISQYETYMARAEELIEEQGLPAGQRFTGKELNDWFDWIRARLAAEGRKTDTEEMTDAELRAHMTRVTELSRAYALRN